MGPEASRGVPLSPTLSPTLFALFIQPLAKLIRDDQVIKDIMVRDSEQRICLSVDNVLLTVAAPEVSIPGLMFLLKDFRIYSRYTLNVQKSLILFIHNYNPQKDKIIRFNSKLSSSVIKCLGIKILL